MVDIPKCSEILVNEGVAMLISVEVSWDVGVLLDGRVGRDALDFLTPNIEENAALMLFRVARASWPEIN